MIYDCLINTEPLKYFPPPPPIHPVSLSAATCECRDIVVVKVVVVILIMILEITINVSNDSRVTYYRGLRAGCLPDLHGLHATLALSPQGFFTKRSPHI